MRISDWSSDVCSSDVSRKFFDDMNVWARSEGHAGLGYINIKDGVPGGPIAKNHGEEKTAKLIEALGLGPNDGVFVAAGKELQAAKLAGAARTRVGEVLGLIEQNVFKFCWIVDFPMYEYDEDNKKVDFSHNPFSMPQGEMQALETMDPLNILAWQYDIRSEEHTSELQSLMRISYAVFCLKTKNINTYQ